VDGLVRGNFYRFKVDARNKCGETNQETFETQLAVVPGKSPQIGTKDEGNCKVSINWDLPDNGGSDITEVQVQIQVDDEGVAVWRDAPCERKEMTRCVMSMNRLAREYVLSAGEEIKARVRAKNSIDWGLWSEISTPNTKMAAPPKVMDVPVASEKSADLRFVVINWYTHRYPETNIYLKIDDSLQWE
jgi:hypothetical protein